jgi:hypothetical protein
MAKAILGNWKARAKTESKIGYEKGNLETKTNEPSEKTCLLFSFHACDEAGDKNMKTRNHANAFVNVATFDTIQDAEQLKSWLINERVPAYVQDETKLQKFWFAAEPKAGVHVQTTKDSFEKVEILLDKTEAQRFLKNAVRCPSCHSLRVQYPDFTRKNFLPTLFGQLFVLLHITKHKYYCEDCHFTWSREDEKPTHIEAPLAR